MSRPLAHILRRTLFRGSKPGHHDCVSVALLPEGLAVVHFRRQQDAIDLLHCALYPCADGDRSDVLKNAVSRLKLSGADCRLVLAHTDYRTLQAVEPEVPASEVRDALRWRVQDLIDFPAAEAEIEYIPMPSPRQGAGRAVTVLACRESLIRDYSSMCEAAGLVLNVIDIPELALRNLAARLPESPRGVALLSLQRDRGTVHLQKGEEIFISRGLNFGSNFLASALNSGDGGQYDALMERLALEVQRSLDYYESFFGQSPVAAVVVTPVDKDTQRLVDGLNRSLGMMARVMELSALVSCQERLDDAAQQACLFAVGASLRDEAVP